MRPRTAVATIILGLLLTVGVATSVYLQHRGSGAPTDAREGTRAVARERETQSFGDAIESLTRIVDEEIVERRALEEKVAELQSELSTLRRQLGVSVSTSPAGDRQNAVEPAAAAAAAVRSVDDRLIAVGFTPAEIEGIRRVEARMQMEQIELDYEARQEGWANTPRYYQALRAASGGGVLRAELGDAAFDRYLYATRGANRVAVSTVIENSPAATAGLRPGDVIHSYGGERVFGNQELTELRSIGTRGIPVVVDVIRDGQRLQLTMPRGPMGVQLSPTTVDPND